MADLPKVRRKVRFPFVLSEVERAKLDWLAESRTMSAATLLRQYINDEYERTHGAREATSNHAAQEAAAMFADEVKRSRTKF